jgi:hypothetical protein
LATAESNRAIPAYQAGPVDQLGRGQQMAEVPTPSARAPFRVQAGAGQPGRFAIRERRAEVLSPTASRRPPVFETEPAARQVHSPWRKTVDTIHRAFTPTRFPDGDHHLVVSSPSEESGRLERHGATRASVSNGARHPGRFTLHERRAGIGAPRGTYRPARSCFPPPHYVPHPRFELGTSSF